MSVLNEEILRKKKSLAASPICAAWKDGSDWIEKVILIGWNYVSTLTVELNYMPNKNTKFFLLQIELENKNLYLQKEIKEKGW